MMFFAICFASFLTGLCVHRRHQNDPHINAVADKVLLTARLATLPFVALYCLSQKVIADAQTKPEPSAQVETAKAPF